MTSLPASTRKSSARCSGSSARRRRRRSSSARLVDWGLAERTAGAVIGGIGLFGQPSVPAEDAYGAAEVADTCAGATRPRPPMRACAVDTPPEPELIDRRTWARAALATLAHAAAPIEERAFAELDSPWPLAPVARSVVGAAAAAEAGVAVGYAARRVLAVRRGVDRARAARPAPLRGRTRVRTAGARADRRPSCIGWRCTRPRT